jgi:hypothetical protein
LLLFRKPSIPWLVPFRPQWGIWQRWLRSTSVSTLVRFYRYCFPLVLLLTLSALLLLFRKPTMTCLVHFRPNLAHSWHWILYACVSFCPPFHVLIVYSLSLSPSHSFLSCGCLVNNFSFGAIPTELGALLALTSLVLSKCSSSFPRAYSLLSLSLSLLLTLSYRAGV